MSNRNLVRGSRIPVREGVQRSSPELVNRPRKIHGNVPWYIYIEGIGDAHTGHQDDADVSMLECIKSLEASGHRITTAKFETCVVPEVNVLDPAMREFYEWLSRKAKES